MNVTDERNEMRQGAPALVAKIDGHEAVILPFQQYIDLPTPWVLLDSTDYDWGSELPEQFPYMARGDYQIVRGLCSDPAVVSAARAFLRDVKAGTWRPDATRAADHPAAMSMASAVDDQELDGLEERAKRWPRGRG